MNLRLIKIDSIQRISPTLEDVFLELTGKALVKDEVG